MTFSSRTTDALKTGVIAAMFTVFSGIPASAQQSVVETTVLGAPSTVELPNEPITVAPTTGLRDDSGFGESIAAAPIDAPSSAAAGLVGAGELGLQPDMWRGTDAKTAIAAVNAAQPSHLWRVNALLRRALIAGAEPPDNADDLLAARASALLRFGAAEDAASLLSAAGADADLALKRTGAEADLLIGREDSLCKSGLADADTAPEDDPDGFWATLRGYCLARSGGPLAAVAIEAMRELGNVNPDDAALLEAIVDEDLAEFIPNPPASNLTPMRIAMLRRLGRTVETMAETAPLATIAGLYALESTSPEGAVRAAERLEAAGTISTKRLVDLYIRHADALEGSALGRRAIFIRDALKAPEARSMGEFLAQTARQDGADAFTQVARALAPVAATLPPEQAQGIGPAAYAIRDALLLGGKILEAGRWADAQGPRVGLELADNNALFAIADANWPGGWLREWGDELRGRAAAGDENARRTLAALAGFKIGPAPRLKIEGFLEAADNDRVAETVFLSMSALDSERPVSAKTLDSVIRALIAVGLRDDARAIAIEAMLKSRWM